MNGKSTTRWDAYTRQEEPACVVSTERVYRLHAQDPWGCDVLVASPDHPAQWTIAELPDTLRPLWVYLFMLPTVDAGYCCNCGSTTIPRQHLICEECCATSTDGFADRTANPWLLAQRALAARVARRGMLA